MKVSRNAPCPCGSGKKYKHCHLGKPLPGEEIVSEHNGGASQNTKGTALILGLVGTVAAIAVGVWQNDVSVALGVAGAWALGTILYLSVRNPPPPNDNAGDPAALNFGRPADRK